MSSGPPEDRSITIARNLILQRRYDDAIALLRSQVQGQKASVRKRLQFADVLILGGRGQEAVPVLLGLSDELAAEGFFAKAVAVLKRADKVQPGRADVAERLAVLVKRPPSGPGVVGAAVPAAPKPAPAVRPPEETRPKEVPPPPPPKVEAEAPRPAVEEPARAPEGPPPPGLLDRMKGAWSRIALPRLASLAGPIMPAAAAPVEPAVPAPSAEPVAAPVVGAGVGPVATSEPAAMPEPAAPSAPPPVEPAAPAEPAAAAVPAEPAVSETTPAATAEPAPAESAPAEPVGFVLVEPAESPAPPAPPAAAAPPEPVAPEEPAAPPAPVAAAEPDVPPEPAPEPAVPAQPAVAAEPIAPAAPAPAEPVAATSPAPEPTAAVAPAEPVVSEAPPAAVETPEPKPDAVPAPVSQAAASMSALADRMRRVFKRMVATLPHPSALRPADPVVVIGPAVEAPPLEAVPTAGEPEAPAAATEAAPEAPLADAVPAEAAPAEPETPPAPTAEAAAPVEPEPAPAPPVEEAPPEPLEALPPVIAEIQLSEADLLDDDTADLETLETPFAGPAAGLLELDDAAFEAKLLDLIEDMIRPEANSPAEAREPPPPPPAPVPLTAEARRLHAIPPFGELGEEELLAVVGGLQLRTFDTGQVVVTEGEEGQSLFVIASGAANVFVRNPVGHNIQVARLDEGEFFGEVASLSGKPRTATVVACAPCELLELDKVSLEQIAHSHQGVRERLNAVFLERVGSPKAALARTVATADAGTEKQAVDVLEAHFGEGGWSPRMKLRLADLLFKAGRQDDVVPVLMGLADELTRGGFPEKAVAVLKKMEQMRRQAPGTPAAPPKLPPRRRASDPPAEAETPTSTLPARTEDFFQDWLLDMARKRVGRARSDAALPSNVPVEPARLAGYLGGLRASPLFQSLAEDELLAFVQGLSLRVIDPGQIILSEGERGESLFLVASGKVKVHVRNPSGRNVEVAELGQAAVFGEIAALTDQPRSATVTTAASCELLELDRAGLAALDERHPGVRRTLEDLYVERASNPQALRIRTFPSS